MKRYPLLLYSILFIVAFIGSVSYFSHYFPSVQAATNHIVISQIQIAGSGNSSQDFIELYNPTDVTMNLTGFKLVTRTSSGSTDNSVVSFTANDTISGHGYYLWCNTSISSTLNCDKSSADTVSNNNSIALRNGSLNTGTLVDAVTIGVPLHPLSEGNIPATPSAGQSLLRKASTNSTAVDLMTGGSEEHSGNGYDSDNNALDFVIMNPSMPRNSKSPQEPPFVSPTISPTLLTPTDSLPPTSTQTPTITPIPTPIPSTPTETPTVTPSPIPTATFTPTPTFSPPTLTPSPSPTMTPTLTPKPTNSPTPTVTPLLTLTKTPTITEIPSLTITPTTEEHNDHRLHFVCSWSPKTIAIGRLHITIPFVHCGWIKGR